MDDHLQIENLVRKRWPAFITSAVWTCFMCIQLNFNKNCQTTWARVPHHMITFLLNTYIFFSLVKRQNIIIFVAEDKIKKTTIFMYVEQFFAYHLKHTHTFRGLVGLVPIRFSASSKWKSISDGVTTWNGSMMTIEKSKSAYCSVASERCKLSYMQYTNEHRVTIFWKTWPNHHIAAAPFAIHKHSHGEAQWPF